MAERFGPAPAPPLTDGDNYRLASGKQKNSRLIVSGNYVYKLNKTEATKGDEQNATYYLECKYETCLARAIIKGGHLTAPSQDRIPHSCEANEGAGLDKIAGQEVLNNMKRRAGSEATTFWVSQISFFFRQHFPTPPSNKLCYLLSFFTTIHFASPPNLD